jgi:hypothetical protein
MALSLHRPAAVSSKPGPEHKHWGRPYPPGAGGGGGGPGAGAPGAGGGRGGGGRGAPPGAAANGTAGAAAVVAAPAPSPWVPRNGFVSLGSVPLALGSGGRLRGTCRGACHERCGMWRVRCCQCCLQQHSPSGWQAGRSAAVEAALISLQAARRTPLQACRGVAEVWQWRMLARSLQVPLPSNVTKEAGQEQAAAAAQGSQYVPSCCAACRVVPAVLYSGSAGDVWVLVTRQGSCPRYCEVHHALGTARYTMPSALRCWPERLLRLLLQMQPWGGAYTMG